MTIAYARDDLGELVNETNQGVATYQLAPPILMDGEDWDTFAMDLTLTNSTFVINGRASADTVAYTNVMQALLGVDSITVSGTYEVTLPSSMYDFQLEWTTTNVANNTVVTFVRSKGV